VPTAVGGEPAPPLANRLWLPAERRLETPAEYRERLRIDYGRTRELLVAHFRSPADANVIAYPFGDIGHLSANNVETASVVNLEIAARY